MEENNTNEEKKDICFENHCWKKCLVMILAAFFGGFLAFYFVADQMMHKYHQNYFNTKKFEKRIFDDFEKSYKQDMKSFDNMIKKHDRILKTKRNDLNMPLFMMDSVKIRTEFEEGNFNIIVDLKPFQFDENKVNYNVSGRKLTLFGGSTVKDSDMEQDIAFSQDFILPKNADTANIKKLKDGKKLIISVPIKDE